MFDGGTMKQGDIAELKIKKTLRIGQLVSEKAYVCELLSYDIQRAELLFALKSGELTELSLEAIYECQIQTTDARLACTGRIRERYCNQNGKILKLQVENGFYKINTK